MCFICQSRHKIDVIVIVIVLSNSQILLSNYVIEIVVRGKSWSHLLSVSTLFPWMIFVKGSSMRQAVTATIIEYQIIDYD